MPLCSRSALTAGVSLTAAAAIALTPVVVSPPAPAPPVAAPQVALVANPAIGVVDTTVTTFDTVFTRLAEATDDPTATASLEILRGLSVRAFAMLAANLRRGDAVLADTTAQVRDLLTTALTESLDRARTAAAHVIDAPLSPAAYAGLLTAAVAGTRLLVGTGLATIQAVGDAGFALAHIAVDEVTFQANNGLGGLSTLLTRLGDASGSPLVEAIVKTVQALTFTPVLAVVNAGSQIAGSVLGAAHTGFDAVLDGAGAAVGAPTTTRVTPTADDDEASRVDTAALRDERSAAEADESAAEDHSTAETTTEDEKVDVTEDDPVDVSSDEADATPETEPNTTVAQEDSPHQEAQDSPDTPDTPATASTADSSDAAA